MNTSHQYLNDEQIQELLTRGALEEKLSRAERILTKNKLKLEQTSQHLSNLHHSSKSKWCARLYEHRNYKGWTQEIIEQGHVKILSDRNDELSSVKVKNGCTLRLYKNHGKDELMDIVTKHKSFLNNYNDQISSLSCYCKGHDSYKKYLALDKKEDNYETIVGRYKFRMKNYKASMSYSKNIGKNIADLTEEVRDCLVSVDELIEVSKLLHMQTKSYVKTREYFDKFDHLIDTVKKLANELKSIGHSSLYQSESIKKQAEHILEECTALEKTANEGKAKSEPPLI